MSELEILLDDSKTIYSPGSIISGHVKLNVSQPHPLTEVSIKLVGYSFVSFGNGQNGYPAKEYHVKAKQVLLKPNNVTIPPHHIAKNENFRFSFKLSENCPSTFQYNKDNLTEYKLVVKKDVPKSNKNIVSSIVSTASSLISNPNVAIVYIEVISLPINPLLIPYLIVEKTQFKEYENTKVTATINRSIFSCGDIIYVTLKILQDQLSENVTLSTSLLKILSRKPVSAEGPTLFIESLFNKNKHAYITQTEVTDERNVSHDATLVPTVEKTFKHGLQIPYELTLSFGENDIIQVKYIVKTMIKFKDKFEKSINLKFSIVLSKDVLPNVDTPSSSSATQSGLAVSNLPSSSNLEAGGPPSYSQALTMPPSNTDDIPPPSYSETVSE